MPDTDKSIPFKLLKLTGLKAGDEIVKLRRVHKAVEYEMPARVHKIRGNFATVVLPPIPISKDETLSEYEVFDITTGIPEGASAGGWYYSASYSHIVHARNQRVTKAREAALISSETEACVDALNARLDNKLYESPGAALAANLSLGQLKTLKHWLNL